ncbi:glycosyltransferase family 2 protein [Providencia sp. CRE-3FA-0001]|uniref:Glycosyltransferase family 2 protein n=1 Tax=Providencia huashanensis TaxID=3037798 RepID=A0AA42K1P5_9GAMM|nr:MULTISPECIES: glycosyltransferase family 2 protein [Providencia]EIU9514901.1 glycosyltransferase [Providencia rettgeri]EJD6663201.1 glycosyltransferase [Providencia rettgeri]ELR5097055.1 glycosyltransferase [Providencia rettgeri]ELR5174191.1 glycosyltransferase [Providencia rettgeri]ELR5197035.1 glycosyltransferase [Providencia rettgeri]
MKISIITATYNSSKTIIDTILSLEKQTYSNIEYIIVDGASSDNTLDIIKKYSTKISTIISEPDKGIYDALNKGIMASTGDIVGFLHSDDIFAYPNAIEDLVNTLVNDESQAIYADLEYVSKENTENVVRRWVSGSYKHENLKKGWMPPHPTFFMKKELYKEHGVFDLNFKISADYDSLLRYLWLHNISVSYLPKVVTKMRVGGESNRSFLNILKKTKEDILVLQKNNIFWVYPLFMKNISKLPQFIKK